MGLLDQNTYQGGTNAQWADYVDSLKVTPMSFTPMDAAKFIAEATPIIGDAMAAKEIYDEIQKPEPNYGLVAVLAGASLIGLVPLIGDAAAAPIKKVARGLLDVVKRVEVDPNALGMSGGNVRLSKPDSRLTVDDVPLIAQHNLNTEGLRTTEDIGGIPMPSIAISNANKPLETFGDISLVMRPDQISPNSNMSVWPADAYTGRQPRHILEYVDEDAALKNITSDPNFNHMGKNILGVFNSLSDADYALKTAQYAIANPSIKVNPKDFSNLKELSREVGKKIGSYGELDEYAGLSAYGDMARKLIPEDPRTSSGAMRKLQNYDMPTLMKRMNKDKAYKVGTEKGASGFAGLMRALLTDKFDNLQDIKNSRGLLAKTDSNDMQDIKSQFESVVDDNINLLSEKYFDGSWRDTNDYLESIAQGKSVSRFDAPAEAMSSAVKILNSFKSEVKDMPTEYFEAKPKTALSLSEFPTAVVPKGNIEAQDILRRQGVNDIQLYDDAVEGMTRADIFRKLNDYKFALPTGGLLGYNMLNNEEQTRKNNMGLL